MPNLVDKKFVTFFVLADLGDFLGRKKERNKHRVHKLDLHGRDSKKKDLIFVPEGKKVERLFRKRQRHGARWV
jgi:hypothetical protein